MGQGRELTEAMEKRMTLQADHTGHPILVHSNPPPFIPMGALLQQIETRCVLGQKGPNSGTIRFGRSRKEFADSGSGGGFLQGLDCF
jgi:hypothetical protein